MTDIVEFDGFENGFYYFDGVSELEIPYRWGADWDEGTEPGILHRPEYKPKFKTPEVRTGDYAVSIHTREATHRCVITNSFKVENGKLYQASVWAMGITGPKGKSGHGMRIGIDATGGLDFRADNVIWSDWYSQYMDVWEDSKWVQLTVSAVAATDVLTVFLLSQNDYKKDAYAHFDDFLLEVESDEHPQEDGYLERIAIALERIAMVLEND